MVPHLDHLPDLVFQLLAGMRLFALACQTCGDKPLISRTGQDIHTGAVITFLRVQPLDAVPARLDVVLCNL